LSFKKRVGDVLGRLRRNRAPQPGSWSFDEETFTVVDAHGEPETIPWSAVDGISAYKANLLRDVEVYVELRTDDEFTLLAESHPSFQKVRAELERRFGISPEWFNRLFDPSFRDKTITLWARGKVTALRRAN